MLTDVRVSKIKHEGSEGIEKHPDRDGLYLAVSKPHKGSDRSTYGSKVWRYEFRWPPTAQGKRQTLTYGKYPELSLAEAREKHLEARKAIANGLNPAEQKQNQKRSLLAALGNTYESIAAKWFDVEKVGKSKSWVDSASVWGWDILPLIVVFAPQYSRPLLSGAFLCCGPAQLPKQALRLHRLH